MAEASQGRKRKHVNRWDVPDTNTNTSSIAPVYAGAPIISPEAAKKAAAEAAQRINAILAQKGVIQKKDPEPFVREIEINDSRNRFLLTKGSTQNQIYRETGCVVITRGKYRPPGTISPEPKGERPLYLHLSSETEEALERGVRAVEDILSQAPHFPPDPRERHPSEKVVMQPVTHKVILGMDQEPVFNVAAKILGPGGSYLQHIEKESNAKISLRGKGSGFLEGVMQQESSEPLHVFISASTRSEVDSAISLATNLVGTVKVQYEQWKTAQNAPRPTGPYPPPYGAPPPPPGLYPPHYGPPYPMPPRPPGYYPPPPPPYGPPPMYGGPSQPGYPMPPTQPAGPDQDPSGPPAASPAPYPPSYPPPQYMPPSYSIHHVPMPPYPPPPPQSAEASSSYASSTSDQIGNLYEHHTGNHYEHQTGNHIAEQQQQQPTHSSQNVGPQLPSAGDRLEYEEAQAPPPPPNRRSQTPPSAHAPAYNPHQAKSSPVSPPSMAPPQISQSPKPPTAPSSTMIKSMPPPPPKRPTVPMQQPVQEARRLSNESRPSQVSHEVKKSLGEARPSQMPHEVKHPSSEAKQTEAKAMKLVDYGDEEDEEPDTKAPAAEKKAKPFWASFD